MEVAPYVFKDLYRYIGSRGDSGIHCFNICVPKQILGLDICGDTIVGDDMQRGISGGQKKRVTTGMPVNHIGDSSEQTRDVCVSIDIVNMHKNHYSSKFFLKMFILQGS